MKCVLTSIVLVFMFLLIHSECYSQDKRGPYINVGYITNLKKCEACTQADRGGSIRLGYLTEGRLGFYAGYLWFKEFHADYIEYDDKGWGVIVGLDFRILRKEDFDWYIKGGVMSEKFISTYDNRTESETSIKPDLGFLFNYRFINLYLGWQPSEPAHYNVGIGFTLFQPSQ
jgi:hypothetical protein